MGVRIISKSKKRKLHPLYKLQMCILFINSISDQFIRSRNSFAMKNWGLVQIFVPLIHISLSVPLKLEPKPPTKPTVFDSVFEYLASLSANRTPCTANSSNPIGIASGAAQERYRWRKGFFVHPDPTFTPNEYSLINSAMYDLQQVLCIPVRIWPQNSQPVGDYAFIKKDTSNSGCYAYIGRQGGKQIINLSVNGCIHKQAITHESIHSLGFDHEHNRPDRDDYIDIRWENLIPGTEYNFNKAEGSLTFGVPYDYKSIMHYWSTAFSKDNKLPTILKKDGGTIGSNPIMSNDDALKLKRMYNCI